MRKLYASNYQKDFNNNANIWKKIKGSSKVYEFTQPTDYDMESKDVENDNAWRQFTQTRWKQEKPEKLPYQDPNYLSKMFPCFQRTPDEKTRNEAIKQHARARLINEIASKFRKEPRLLPEGALFRTRSQELLSVFGEDKEDMELEMDLMRATMEATHVIKPSVDYVEYYFGK